MLSCRKCFVISFVWWMMNLTDGKALMTTRDITYSSAEITFRPQIPSITGNPRCAGNLTFCENINSYPYNHLKYILQRNDSYFRYIMFHKVDVKEEISNRHNSEGSFVCRSISKTVFPKLAKNKSNKWKYVINQDNYLQGVKVETCYNSNGSCDVIGNVPSIYTTFCRQKYVYSKLLSLSDNGYPTPDVFKIPSACCCAYRRNTFFLKKIDDA